MQDTPPLQAPAPSLLRPLPVPVTNVPVAVRKHPAPHFLAVFFLSFFLGVFGADKFYLRKYGSAIFKFLTFGGFGIVAIVDLALIMNGAMSDRDGQAMVGYEEYKALAKKTVVWITVVIGAFLILNGVLLVFGVIELSKSLTNPTSGLSGLGLDQSSLDSLGGL